MATSISLKAKEAFVQYSKKMCTVVSIFWMVYRILNFIVVLIRPETAAALVDLCAGVDTVMIVNISTYTGNSIAEKGIIAFSQRKNVLSANKDESDDDESDDTESNG